jgi:hypothetical protein
MKIILKARDQEQYLASFNIEARGGHELSRDALIEELSLAIRAGEEAVFRPRGPRVGEIYAAPGTDGSELLQRLLNKCKDIGYSVSVLIDNTGQ